MCADSRAAAVGREEEVARAETVSKAEKAIPATTDALRSRKKVVPLAKEAMRGVAAVAETRVTAETCFCLLTHQLKRISH